MTCRFGYFSLIYLIMLIWKIELPWDESWRYSRKTGNCYLQSIINLKLYISQQVDKLKPVKCSESRSQWNLHTIKYDPTFESLRVSSHMDLFLKDLSLTHLCWEPTWQCANSAWFILISRLLCTCEPQWMRTPLLSHQVCKPSSPITNLRKSSVLQHGFPSNKAETTYTQFVYLLGKKSSPP